MKESGIDLVHGRMVSSTFASEQIVGQQVRPTKVAIIHGSSLPDSSFSHDEIHDTLTSLFSPLSIRVFSTLELGENGMSDLRLSRTYDVIGLVGEPADFSALKTGMTGIPSLSDQTDNSDNDVPILLSFNTRTHFRDSKKYLDFSDAVIFCEAEGNNWPQEVFRIMCRLFESLVVPSMLNIDLADVKRIAKRIGLAFNLSDDNHEKIIEMLPKDCYVARSAILHFSCTDDVRLREIYSISNSIALKKGLTDSDLQLSSHSEARKNIRNVNIKLGIRIIGKPHEAEKETRENSIESDVDGLGAFQDEKRISMTAILFGI